jgi:hypothetical protein
MGGRATGQARAWLLRPGFGLFCRGWCVSLACLGYLSVRVSVVPGGPVRRRDQRLEVFVLGAIGFLGWGQREVDSIVW